jgi:hypothetical protein
MKKNYKIIKIVVILAVSFSAIASCSKSFLNEKIYSSFTPEALSDSLAFEAAVAGIQSQYMLWHTYAEDPAETRAG